MPETPSLVPLLRLAALGLAIACVPAALWWWRHRARRPRARALALLGLTLFLTFDLTVFGAFTRLSDAGLGCPDWPGCYGEASPLGAHADIRAEQALRPDGPVTWAKAWIEMLHRYLAMGVGALIVGLCVFAWRERRRLPELPAWAGAALVWVIAQGLFGRFTVTLKLYPAIVTLHLLGAMGLLALLSAARERLREDRRWRAPLPAPRLAWLAATALGLQIALGGWVSTNYAVLACQGFPACNGQWWPSMDLSAGFTLLRELGRGPQGHYLGFEALVAIHWVHRLGAVVAALCLAALAGRLMRHPDWRRRGAVLAALLALQLATGLSNVVLRWPLVAALLHTAGAAALVLALTPVLARRR